MKKFMALVLAVACVFAFTACGVEIPDNNGPDDDSLSTITDQDIMERTMGASGYSMSPGLEEEDYMTSVTKFKGKAFSGVEEIYSTNFIGKSDIIVDLSTIQVTEGNFKLVATLDDEIVHVFDNEEMSQSFELRDVKGYFAIRMAGESANFKFYINVW